MHARVPALLMRGLSPEQASDVDRWWQELAPADRRGLRPNAGRAPARVTAHPEARAALAAGRIPAEFRCPLRRAACPLRDQAPGCDVRFSIDREADSPAELRSGGPR
jgi:hypothetical protein